MQSPEYFLGSGLVNVSYNLNFSGWIILHFLAKYHNKYYECQASLISGFVLTEFH